MKQAIKLTVLSLLLSASFSLTSCGNSTTSESQEETTETTDLTPQQQRTLKGLKAELERVKKQLPMPLADGLTLKSMEIRDGFMVTTCTYPKGEEMEVLDNPETKAAIIRSVGPTAKRLKDINMGIKYIYQEEGTDNIQTLTITPEEI